MTGPAFRTGLSSGSYAAKEPVEVRLYKPWTPGRWAMMHVKDFGRQRDRNNASQTLL